MTNALASPHSASFCREASYLQCHQVWMQVNESNASHKHMHPRHIHTYTHHPLAHPRGPLSETSQKTILGQQWRKDQEGIRRKIKKEALWQERKWQRKSTVIQHLVQVRMEANDRQWAQIAHLLVEGSAVQIILT